MKSTLIAIDAKYPHTNLAVRSIAACAGRRGISGLAVAEFTINQHPDFILSGLYRLDSGVYLFSAYIWNIELIRQIAPELRKIRPRAAIWIGGPEVSYHSAAFLRQNPAFDLVIRGEGEETVPRLLLSGDAGAVPGVSLRRGDEILETPDACPPDIDTLPFPYEDPGALTGRVLYYESMRGCPFSCAYCLSSIGRGVRFRGLEQVCSQLQRFLDARVKRVKLVDRTFNCDKQRALAIWRFLAERDNGVTNFHFELAGELLDDEALDFLATVRPGLFQFEIGVQSANPQTLREIRRPGDLPRLRRQVERLARPGNIHLHLDLIAGLPHEDYASFARSFNEVYAMRPAQLQLGFLKVLKGSAIERDAARYGLCHRDTAPYQVLSTNWISFGELARLARIEDMVERYYNSGRHTHLAAALCARFPSPFAFYEALADYWAACGFDRAPPDRLGQHEALGGFMRSRGMPLADRERWLCRYDLALSEPPRRQPAWVEETLPAQRGGSFRAFYEDPDRIGKFLPGFVGWEPRQIARRTHLERFPFHPGTAAQTPVCLLFDYSRRDILGHALVQEIPDE